MWFIRFFRDFALGLSSCYRAIPFVFKHGFWPYFLISGAVSGAAIYVGYVVSDDVLSYEIPETARGNMLDLTTEVAIWFFKLLLLVMVAKLNKYIVLVLMPPALTRISERTEYHLTGNKYKFTLPRFWSDIKRSIRIVANNFMWEAGLLLILLFFSIFFDILKEIYPYYAFAIGLYFYGFSMIDYSLERLRMSMDDSKKYIRKHMGLAVGVGFVYSSLVTFAIIDFSWFTSEGFLKDIVLYVGVIFAPVICVVAATMGVHKISDLSQNPHAIKAGNATTEGPETSENPA